MIKNQIKTDLINALKNKDNKQVNILRYILSKFQLQEIDKKQELTEEEEIGILRKIIKELSETLESAQKAGRQEIVDKTEFELLIVKKYLPQELSHEQLEEEIKKIVEKNQELFQKNPKALIGVCIKELKTKAETSKIINILNSVINRDHP